MWAEEGEPENETTYVYNTCGNFVLLTLHDLCAVCMSSALL